jgi:hypothetical protein
MTKRQGEFCHQYLLRHMDINAQGKWEKRPFYEQPCFINVRGNVMGNGRFSL